MALSLRSTLSFILVALTLLVTSSSTTPVAAAAEDSAATAGTPETYQFQAEVTRLMDILINSLYTNRDIFLRELISNSADALDKQRYTSLQAGTATADIPLEIRISTDKTEKVLMISDTGIGMTHDDLIQNLGVIASSGTSAFIQAATSGANKAQDSLQLIGQFGVGFYSVYLVADRVEVTSRHVNSTSAYTWSSTADKTFTITPSSDQLRHGTTIKLYLKEDALEYIEEAKLKSLITKYSEFISWPIYLQQTRTETVEVEADEDSDIDTTTTPTDDLDVTDDDAAAKEPAAPATETRSVTEFVQINEQPAIWTRKAADISDEEYNEFYKILAKGASPTSMPATEAPLARIHFTAEGDLNFHALLYIPGKPADNFYQTLYNNEHEKNIRLYVRKVLISDSATTELLPRYLIFLKGVIDSDDLPLNVNREQLSSQQSKVLKSIGKKVVRKILDTLTKLSNDSREKQLELRKSTDITTTATTADDTYLQFYEHYGPSIKLGILDDSTNKKKLTKLLRFKTAKYGKDKWLTLDDYVEDFNTQFIEPNADNPVKAAKQILYLTCSSYEQCSESPLIERPLALGYDILYLTEPLDEYLVQSLTTHDGFKLQSVAKEGLKLDGDSKQSQSRSKRLKEEYEPLISWLTTLYTKHGSKFGVTGVSKVELSQRIKDSPCVLVSSAYGYSANMERIMKAQTFASSSGQSADSFMRGKKILEINPFHPVIKALNDKIAEQGGAESVGYDSEDSKVSELVDIANLLYDSAAVASGYTLEKSNSFASRVERLVRQQLKVARDAKADEPDLTVEERAQDDAIKGEASKPAASGSGVPSGLKATLAGTGPDGPGADIDGVDMEELMAKFQASQDGEDHDEL